MKEKEELINSYDELDIGDKRKELGREIAETTVVVQKLINDLNPNYQIKPMEEFINLFEENTSEEKFLTGLYEDILDLQETIGTYCEFSTALYYDEEEVNPDDNQSYMYEGNAGFAKLWILGLITALISVAVIILGIILTI